MEYSNTQFFLELGKLLKLVRLMKIKYLEVKMFRKINSTWLFLFF